MPTASQRVEWAARGGAQVFDDMRVDHRRFDASVSQQFPDLSQIHALQHRDRGEGLVPGAGGDLAARGEVGDEIADGCLRDEGPTLDGRADLSQVVEEPASPVQVGLPGTARTVANADRLAERGQGVFGNHGTIGRGNPRCYRNSLSGNASFFITRLYKRSYNHPIRTKNKQKTFENVLAHEIFAVLEKPLYNHLQDAYYKHNR